MAQDRLTDRDRTILAICAVGGVVYAIALTYLWDGLLRLDVVASSPALSDWLRIVLAAVPSCLAVAAVVLSGRVGVAVAIGVAAAVAGTIASALRFGGMELGIDEYASWIGSGVVLACALVGADLVVWRWGTGTPALGALAGLVAGVASLVLAGYLLAVTGGPSAFEGIGLDYWLREYGAVALLQAAVGAAAGVALQRRDVPQETAGLV